MNFSVHEHESGVQTSVQAGARSILAVIVLYKVAADESQSFVCMRALLAADPQLAAAIDLVICDNTPYEQPRPAGFDGLYLADVTNPGLAKCYNRALDLAVERRLPWLLLFDQDTVPTAEYLHELLAESRSLLPDQTTVALVPKLVQNGVVQSPHARPTYRHPKFDPTVAGYVPGPLYAFNSASLIRVSALQAIEGFPEEFWLDFLDHATFHMLQLRGGKIFVLRSSLAHDLSANSIAKRDDAGRRRYQNILDAEYTFYRKYGSFMDHVYHRIRLLRGALGQLIKRRNPSESLQMFKVAIRR